MAFEGDYFQSTTLISAEEYTRNMFESTAGAPSSEMLAEVRELILDQQKILYSIFRVLLMMSKTLSEIKEEIRDFKEEYASTESENVIIVREIPYEEAKKIVEEYLAKKEGEILYPSEIAEALQLPYDQVHEIVLELIEEGKVKIAEDKEA